MQLQSRILLPYVVPTCLTSSLQQNSLCLLERLLYIQCQKNLFLVLL
uniref:Uncharacterized protein n=1 Tax=Manihot esculenta TaxID=3983 RepID=A0A2C9VH68_MANES